jgi:hypothetical protein
MKPAYVAMDRLTAREEPAVRNFLDAIAVLWELDLAALVGGVGAP